MANVYIGKRRGTANVEGGRGAVWINASMVMAVKFQILVPMYIFKEFFDIFKVVIL